MVKCIVAHPPEVTSDSGDVVWLGGVSYGIILAEDNALFGESFERGRGGGGLKVCIFQTNLEVMVVKTERGRRGESTPG